MSAAVEVREEGVPFSSSIPFVHHLGLERLAAEAGHSRLRLEPQPEHLNSYGMVHGGVLMTCLDVAMALAARTEEAAVVTVEMTTSFMRPMRGPLLALGQLLYASGSLAFTRAEIKNSRGHVCAHATGTFKRLK